MRFVCLPKHHWGIWDKPNDSSKSSTRGRGTYPLSPFLNSGFISCEKRSDSSREGAEFLNDDDTEFLLTGMATRWGFGMDGQDLPSCLNEHDGKLKRER